MSRLLSDVALACCAATLVAWQPLAFAQSPSSAKNATCSAQSGATKPTIVELYTSEGCDSCPPADRWMSSLVASTSGTPVIAMSFHVDYWDYIGWKDEFARKEFGVRHAALVRASRATGVYTPQLFVDGREDRAWTVGRKPEPASAATKIALAITGEWRSETLSFQGRIKPAVPGAAMDEALKIRYVFTENGIETRVKAGENKGVTLKHDALVRDHGYAAVSPDGAFSAALSLKDKPRRSQSTLHVIAERPNGEAVAAASVRCE